MTDQFTYWVCTDCYMAHHYGPGSCESAEWDRDRYLATVESVGGDRNIADNTDPETGEGCREFSWSSCDTCDSRLGGYRYRMAVRESIPF
jgi:hypothetical protein